ncbi:MAG: hypothetical protein NTW89_03575 [Burkholderiales bacterium]|nr:hypothetical protein [Burkholderiales bacterium]
MNIELDEVVVQNVSDDALEMAAGGAQAAEGGNRGAVRFLSLLGVSHIADR